MGQESDEIRQQIEATRGRMSETVGAIGYRTDVKGRAGDYVAGKGNAIGRAVTSAKEAIAGSAGSAREAVASGVGGAAATVGDALPDREQLRHGTGRAIGIAGENPIGLLVGGVALGFLVGLVGRTTRIEDEKLGSVADQVKDAARQTGQEALERGRQVAQDVAGAATETARDRAQEAAQELGGTAQQAAQRIGT